MPSGKTRFLVAALIAGGAAAPSSAAEGIAELCARRSPDHLHDVERWPGGPPRRERCLIDGALDGPYREASPDGRSLVEGEYRRGVASGQWRRWHPRGEAESQGAFEEGKESGPWRYWHRDGTPKAEGSYRCGVRVGQWRYFAPGGAETRRSHGPAGAACGRREFRWQASAGYSSILYRETGHGDLNMTAVTVKAGYRMPAISEDWEAGFSGYFTLLPLASTNDASTARFLGLNARIGWVVPSVSSPWRLSLSGGAYYTTMIVSGEALGFSNLIGPQVFASLRRETGEGEAVGAYLKYSLMMDGFSIFGLSNREFGGGFSYERAVWGGNPGTVSLDLANLRLDFEGSHVSSSSVTLSLGYGF